MAKVDATPPFQAPSGSMAEPGATGCVHGTAHLQRTQRMKSLRPLTPIPRTGTLDRCPTCRHVAPPPCPVCHQRRDRAHRFGLSHLASQSLDPATVPGVPLVHRAGFEAAGVLVGDRAESAPCVPLVHHAGHEGVCRSTASASGLEDASTSPVRRDSKCTDLGSKDVGSKGACANRGDFTPPTQTTATPLHEETFLSSLGRLSSELSLGYLFRRSFFSEQPVTGGAKRWLSSDTSAQAMSAEQHELSVGMSTSSQFVGTPVVDGDDTRHPKAWSEAHPWSCTGKADQSVADTHPPSARSGASSSRRLASWFSGSFSSLSSLSRLSVSSTSAPSLAVSPATLVSSLDEHLHFQEAECTLTAAPSENNEGVAEYEKQHTAAAGRDALWKVESYGNAEASQRVLKASALKQGSSVGGPSSRIHGGAGSEWWDGFASIWASIAALDLWATREEDSRPKTWRRSLATREVPLWQRRSFPEPSALAI